MTRLKQRKTIENRQAWSFFVAFYATIAPSFYVRFESRFLIPASQKDTHFDFNREHYHAIRRKAAFENISVKFGDGNRYGLIGANGCGKSTFMKLLGGDLEPTSGNVSLDPDDVLGKLRQDQFAYEEFSVIDTVIMGDTALWEVKQERDRIYSLPEMSEEDGIKVADLEVAFGEMDGYTAESRAGELLLGLEIPVEQHLAPCRKSRRAGSCGYCWRKRCSRIRTSCCWTSRPTTSTSTPSVGWKAC